jgi:tetratricopeptide (TPR) repeat protein
MKKQKFPPLSALLKKIFPRRSLLSFVFAGGLALSVILSAALLFFAVMGIRPASGQAGKGQGAKKDADSFYMTLGEFDRSPARSVQTDALLAELEKKALSVDSRLSVLKRLRKLAQEFPEYTGNYRDAALRAQEDFPYSESLALAASESLLLAAEAQNSGQGFAERDLAERGGFDPALRAHLGALAAKLSAGSQPLAALALRVLAGECADPRLAAAIPEAERLFGIAAAQTRGLEHELLTMNGALLRIHNGNIPGALVQIESLLNEGETSERTLKTAAALIYDYGDPLRAAALLAPFTDPESIAREADALYLGGGVDGAKNLWKLLLSPGDEVPQAIRERALYNLGVLATDKRAALGYLEELFRINPGNSSGIMRYSRLLPAPEAVALLEGLGSGKPGNADFPLELEILKRKRDLVQPARLTAETWLLINKYPKEPAVYEWGAFYFGLQRLYDESAILLKNAGFNNVESPALSLYEALFLILNGAMESGEAHLLDLAKSGQADWSIYANLGRLREARRSPGEALAYYQAALSPPQGPEAAPPERARVELRAARVNLALGKTQEARKSLDHAAELDPDNLSIQVEIHRLRGLLGY